MRTVCFVAVAMILVAMSGQAARADGVFGKAEGRWDSEWQTSRGGTQTGRSTFDSYGQMSTIDGPVVTFYTADDSGYWEGYWTAPNSPHPCATEKDGYRHWGVVKFQFDESYDQFTGTWDFCGEGETWEWQGKRGTW